MNNSVHGKPVNWETIARGFWDFINDRKPDFSTDEIDILTPRDIYVGSPSYFGTQTDHLIAYYIKHGSPLENLRCLDLTRYTLRANSIKTIGPSLLTNTKIHALYIGKIQSTLNDFLPFISNISHLVIKEYTSGIYSERFYESLFSLSTLKKLEIGTGFNKNEYSLDEIVELISADKFESIILSCNGNASYSPKLISSESDVYSKFSLGKNLLELNLGNIELGLKFSQLIFQQLSLESSELTHIELNCDKEHCPTKEIIPSISAMLKTNKTLLSLKLFGSYTMDHIPTRELAVSLCTNRTLSTLYIPYIKFLSPKIGGALLDVIFRFNTTLNTLDLGSFDENDYRKTYYYASQYSSSITSLTLRSSYLPGGLINDRINKIFQPIVQRNRHNEIQKTISLFSILLSIPVHQILDMQPQVRFLPS